MKEEKGNMDSKRSFVVILLVAGAVAMVLLAASKAECRDSPELMSPWNTSAHHWTEAQWARVAQALAQGRQAPWVEDQVFTADDGEAEDYFGVGLDMEGDTALIGAHYTDEPGEGNAGSVYVFENSSGVWSQVDRLTASDYDNSNFFGSRVAMSGDTAVFGAYGYLAKTGAAYVFVHDGTDWTQQQKLTATDGASLDNFGYSVAVDADTAVIGAYQDSHGSGPSEGVGSAYVFTRSGTTWSFQQKLTAASPTTADWFGYRVAISGDTIVIGDLFHDTTGAAYIFVRSGGTWTQQQKLTGSGGADDSYFGTSVDISGETVIIGSSNSDHGMLTDAGAAYVFTRSGTIWTEEQKLTASDAASDDRFGACVSITGDRAAVTATWDEVSGEPRAGAAYLFTRSGSSWTEDQKLVISDPSENDYLAGAMALEPHRVLLGVSSWDTASDDQVGAAYLFLDPAYIFEDGFESGETESWSSATGP